MSGRSSTGKPRRAPLKEGTSRLPVTKVTKKTTRKQPFCQSIQKERALFGGLFETFEPAAAERLQVVASAFVLHLNGREIVHALNSRVVKRFDAPDPHLSLVRPRNSFVELGRIPLSMAVVVATVLCELHSALVVDLLTSCGFLWKRRPRPNLQKLGHERLGKPKLLRRRTRRGRLGVLAWPRWDRC